MNLAAQTTTPKPYRAPAIIPPDAPLKDVADAYHARGLRLVTDGRKIYVTPLMMPDEREVAVKVAA